MEKKKKGRPSKIDTIDIKQLKRLAEQGLTDKQISYVLNIAESTLNEYKKKYPDFSESLKNGKEYADNIVEKSLFERAKGYKHEDVHISNYQGKITITPIIKHYPPDTTSCIFWLKNRKPLEWRENPVTDDGDIDNDLNFEGW